LCRSSSAGIRTVTQTTGAISVAELAKLRQQIDASPTIHLRPVDEAIADAFTMVDRAVLRDPWDRFIVATAQVLDAELVTRDGAIRESALVSTIW
jgi:PIN domain nuclease of toxin-antitoxin system